MNKQKMNPQEQIIYEGLDNLVYLCHKNSYDAGWWMDLNTKLDLREELRSGTRYGKALLAEKLVLIHSEISEAMEGARKSLADDKLPQYSMLMTELADATIRIADLAGAIGVEDFAEVLLAKLQYNKNRPDHKIENRLAEGGKAY